MGKERLLFRIPHIELDPVIDQVTDQAAIQQGTGSAYLFTIIGDSHDLFANDRNFLDVLGFDVSDEVGIGHRIRRCGRVVASEQTECQESG